jgi:hypothetical protein
MDENKLAEKIAEDVVELFLSSPLGISRQVFTEKIKEIVLDNLEHGRLLPFDPTKQNEGLIGSDGLSDLQPYEVKVTD